MKKFPFFCAVTLMLILLFAISEIFAAGTAPELRDAKPEDVRGIFTLILYGGKYLDDLETVAILDLEGDRYTFEPYAPGYDYKIKGGIPAKEALEEAEKFVSFHSSFRRTILGKILDKEGNTIGYEVRPLYYPTTFGVSDVLDVDYFIRDGKVISYIRLKPAVEKQLHGGDKGKED